MAHRMWRNLSTLTAAALAVTIATKPALAHILPGPHTHPHGLEGLVALAALALAVLSVAGIKAIRRRTRPPTKDDAPLD